MARFFDLHSHMLCGVDDGPETPEEMYAMLETAYEDGIRALCLTPHYSPYLFGETLESSKESFALLQAYVAEKHPDMKLFLGHELGYHHSCPEALADGRCRTLARGRYLLVDFPETVEFYEIQKAMDQLQGIGYFPVLAHTERYRCLAKHLDWVEDFVDRGGVVQVNASSVVGSWGGLAKKQWKKLFKMGLIHVISTDAHNLTSRPPKMSVCMDFLAKHCSAAGIRELTWDNACRIINNERL